MRSFAHMAQVAENRLPTILQKEQEMHRENGFALPPYLAQPVEEAAYLRRKDKEMLAKLNIETVAGIRTLRAKELIKTSTVDEAEAKEFEKIAYDNGLWFFEDYNYPQNIQGMIAKQLKKPNQPVIGKVKKQRTQTDYALHSPTGETTTAQVAREALTPELLEKRKEKTVQFWENLGAEAPDHLSLPVGLLEGPDQVIALFKRQSIETLGDLAVYRNLQEIPEADTLDPNLLQEADVELEMQGVLFSDHFDDPRQLEDRVREGTQHWVAKKVLLPSPR